MLQLAEVVPTAGISPVFKVAAVTSTAVGNGELIGAVGGATKPSELKKKSS